MFEGYGLCVRADDYFMFADDVAYANGVNAYFIFLSLALSASAEDEKRLFANFF